MKYEIQFKEAEILLSNKEKILEDAILASNEIKSIEINDDNIKIAKSKIKEFKTGFEELETERKKIKNIIMKPHDQLHDFTKEIKKIIEDTEFNIKKFEQQKKDEFIKSRKEFIKTKIDEEEAKTTVEELTNKNPKLLLKSTSEREIENEVKSVNFKIEQDLRTVKDICEITDASFEIAEEMYIKNGLEFALSYAKAFKKQAPTATNPVDETEQEQAIKQSKSFKIEIEDEFDYDLVVQFMEENNIKFKEMN